MKRRHPAGPMWIDCSPAWIAHDLALPATCAGVLGSTGQNRSKNTERSRWPDSCVKSRPTKRTAMNRMLAGRTLSNDTRGANLVEYIILVGVVALIALAGFKVFGS